MSWNSSMNIVGQSNKTQAFITTHGARHYVRRFMASRQEFRELGSGLPKSHVITWLGRDDGFAADLAMMARRENPECILSEPETASLMPLWAVIIVPRIDEETLKEVHEYRTRRKMFASDDVDTICYSIVSRYGSAIPSSVVTLLEGPDLTVHCEWIHRDRQN